MNGALTILSLADEYGGKVATVVTAIEAQVTELTREAEGGKWSEQGGSRQMRPSRSPDATVFYALLSMV